MTDVRRRRWFGEAHATIAGVIAACMMGGRVVPAASQVITEQLERAYRRGVADAKAGRA